MGKAEEMTEEVRGLTMTSEFAPMPEMDEATSDLWDKGMQDWLKKGGFASMPGKRFDVSLSEPTIDINSRIPTFYEIGKLEIKVEWIVEGEIPKQAIVVLTAPGGGLKTMLCLKIGSCIAEGRPFVGLLTQKIPVYYVDFENPLALLSDRAKLLGGSSMRVWHLSNIFSPPRLDTDEWILFKALTPGLLIFDTLRSAQLLDENSSRDMALIMGRLKELREMGFTILLIHHSPKADDRKYKGSTAISDLADHCLVLERVRAVGSDELAEDQDDEDLPIRLGVRGKSRFESTPIFMKFDSTDGFTRARNPNDELMDDILEILNGYDSDNGGYPNQTELCKIGKEELSLNRKKMLRLLKNGEGKLWAKSIVPGTKKVIYKPYCPDHSQSKRTQITENTTLSHCPDPIKNKGTTHADDPLSHCPPLLYRGTKGLRSGDAVDNNDSFLEEMEENDEGE